MGTHCKYFKTDFSTSSGCRYGAKLTNEIEEVQTTQVLNSRTDEGGREPFITPRGSENREKGPGVVGPEGSFAWRAPLGMCSQQGSA